MSEKVRAMIVRILTTHSIVEVEQGRSFPLSEREADYAATCFLADDEFMACLEENPEIDPADWDAFRDGMR